MLRCLLWWVGVVSKNSAPLNIGIDGLIKLCKTIFLFLSFKYVMLAIIFCSLFCQIFPSLSFKYVVLAISLFCFMLWCYTHISFPRKDWPAKTLFLSLFFFKYVVFAKTIFLSLSLQICYVGNLSILRYSLQIWVEAHTAKESFQKPSFTREKLLYPPTSIEIHTLVW